MSLLFTLPELAAYMQQPDVNEATGELIRELVTDLIADVSGAPIPDQFPPRFKRVALAATKRAYLNPNGYVSESLGDYSYSRGARSGAGVESSVYLTDAERASILASSGRSSVRSVKLVTPFEFSEDDDIQDSWL